MVQALGRVHTQNQIGRLGGRREKEEKVAL
jgi:hypothetical protein